MLQQWNLRSRGHQCAVTERPFEDGERHFTAIYIDPKSSEYTRRDVCVDAWKQELAERTPFSFWKSVYVKNAPDQKPEFAPKESALSLLQRLIEDDHPNTENARYILAAMLERKRILSPTDRKYTEQGIMQFYENKKTGDVYMIRDPELRLDEVAGVQEEVAMLLGFGGPAAEAAKAVGMKITPEGKVEPAAGSPPDAAPETNTSESPLEPSAAEQAQPAEAETAEVEAAEPEVQEPGSTEPEPLAEEPAPESEVEEEDLEPDFEDEDEMEPGSEEEDIESVADQEEDDEAAAEPETPEPEVGEAVAEPDEPVETTDEPASPQLPKKKTAAPRRPAIKIEVYETEATGEDEGESVMEPEYDDTEDDKR